MIEFRPIGHTFVIDFHREKKRIESLPVIGHIATGLINRFASGRTWENETHVIEGPDFNQNLSAAKEKAESIRKQISETGNSNHVHRVEIYHYGA